MLNPHGHYKSFHFVITLWIQRNTPFIYKPKKSLNNMEDLILIHISPEAVKGYYRPLFERNFIQKLSKELQGLGHKSIRRKYQRIFIDLNQNSKISSIKEKLSSMKEINYFCFPKKINNSIKEIEKAALNILESSKIKSFKPKIKISYRASPLNVSEFTKNLGNYLIKKTNKILDFIEPDVTIYIEVLENATYIYDMVYKHKSII